MKLLSLLFLLVTASCTDSYQDPNSECKGIVDIYYAGSSKKGYIYSLETSQRGRHFVTMTPCSGCSTSMIERSNYDNWAKKFLELNVKPPHPKRTDVDSLICHPFEGYKYKYTGHNPVYADDS